MKLHALIRRAQELDLDAGIYAGEDGETVSVHFKDRKGNDPIGWCILVTNSNVDRRQSDWLSDKYEARLHATVADV